MKILVIVLAAAVVVFGVLYLQSDRARIRQSLVLQETQEQLTTISNQVVTTEVELATTKKQVTELEQSLTAIGNEKAKVE